MYGGELSRARGSDRKGNLRAASRVFGAIDGNENVEPIGCKRFAETACDRQCGGTVETRDGTIHIRRKASVGIAHLVDADKQQIIALATLFRDGTVDTFGLDAGDDVHFFRPR